MIKHIVLWKLHDFANGNTKEENALLIKEKLESLKGKIPGLLKVEVGFNYKVSENAADIVLYSEFDSKKSEAEYQTHPEHKKFVEFISSCRYERRVIDYEIET
jgi:hypothetical protein